MNDKKNIFEESTEEVRAISALESARDTIIPDASLLKSALLNAEVQTASAKSFQFGWKIIAPVGVFAALILAFTLGTQRFSGSPEDAVTETNKLSINEDGRGAVAALAEPIPAPTGSLDDTVAVLFTDMDQEFAALESQANAEIVAAQNESNELNTFTTYAEPSI